MHASTQDLPVVVDFEPIKVQSTADWGDFETQFLTYKVDTDLAPLLKGLPGDLCQSSHWGYVIKGSLRVIYADHEEVIQAGDLFYMAPGHSPIIEAGTEMLQFSPKGEVLNQTSETIRKNMIAMQPSAGSLP